MSQNFSDKSNNNENQAEIESLVAAFYTERAPQHSRADHLWQQLAPHLKTVPARPRKFGFWFTSSNMARNNTMQTETPLFDQQDEIPANPPRRRALVGSLLGVLATLILVAGLILVVSLATGKTSQSGPPVGSQGQAVQNTAAPASTVLPPTATPPPFDGTPLPAAAIPGASPTPPPFQPPTPTAAGSTGTKPTPFPPTAGQPGPTPVPGSEPTVGPDATATPTPWDGKSPIPPTVVPNATATPTLNAQKPTSSTNPNQTVPLAGTLNVAVKYLQVVPINFNQNALPPNIRVTDPVVSYYGALQDGSTVLTELHTALVAAGYKYTSSDGSTASAPAWQPTGTAAFYTKNGRPDLYITVANLPTSEEVKQYVANVGDGGISDYEGVIEGMRGKGFKTLVAIMDGNNLLQVMRNGQDPGAGSPTVSPQPTK